MGSIGGETMIIYEVVCYILGANKKYVFFSNKRKASAFVAQNKKSFNSLKTKKHLVPNNKTDIIKFLNGENKI